MTDAEMVEAFLRDTLKDDKRNLQAELVEAMDGYEPDAMTQAIAFAMFASAASIMSEAIGKKPVKMLDAHTGESTEVAEVPKDILDAMAQASIVLSLARDEDKHSPLYYVQELVAMVCAEEGTEAEQMRADFEERCDKHTAKALDNVRKRKHITAI
jgi:hypothetical protein